MTDAIVKGGRFVVQRKLGQGAFGAVYLATDRDLDRPVALKVLATRSRRVDEAVARFCREAAIQSTVRHPNLVEVYAAGLDEAEPWLAMELVEGVDLAEVRDGEGAQPAREALRLLDEAGAALEALHAAGVLHRDLKPGNLMRRADGRFVVMDLGLARQDGRTALTATGALVGTPAYLAPELMRDGEFTPGVDLYQLGAVAFEYWSGRRLVPGKTLDELVRNVVQGVRNPYPDEAGPEADALRARLDCLLSPDPARRSLDPAATPPPPDPPRHPSGAVGQQTGQYRREPGGPPRALVVAVLAAAAAGGFYFTAPPSAPDEVRWAVVGSRLLVSWRRVPGLEGVAIELDGTAVEGAVAEGLGPGREGRVVEGLDPQRDRRARLVWRGGGGPVVGVRGEPDVVAEAPRMVAGGAVQLRLRRPAQLAWEGQAPADHPAGAVRLEWPEKAAAATLVVREQGLDQRLSLARAQLRDAALARALAALDDADPEADLRAAVSAAAPPPSFAALRDAWRPTLSAAPRWLRGAVGQDPARLFAALQRVAWTAAAERSAHLDHQDDLAALPIEDLPSPPRARPGARLPRKPPKAFRGGGPVALDPVDGASRPGWGVPGNFVLVDPRVKFATFTGRTYDAASRLRFRWPAGVPGDVPVVALTVERVGFRAWHEVVVRPEDPGPDRLEVRVFPTRDQIQGDKVHHTHSVYLPGALAPAAGTPMEVVLRGQVRPAPETGRIGGLTIRWPARGGAAASG